MNFEDLKNKMNYSAILDSEDIKETYKGFNISDKEKAFNSKEEVEAFLEEAKKDLLK